jgi:hypothetical protein
MREHQNMSKRLHYRNYIASYLNYIAIMSRKRAFGDAGLARPPSRVATMGGKGIRKAPAGGRGQEPVWIFSKQPSYTACVAARGGSIIEKKACQKPFSEYNTKIWR